MVAKICGQASKTSYSIRDFINDTLSSLVVNAVSPAGLGIGNVPQGITPQIVTLDLPEGEMINRIWEERTNKRVSIDDVLKYRKIKGGYNSSNNQECKRIYPCVH